MSFFLKNNYNSTFNFRLPFTSNAQEVITELDE